MMDIMQLQRVANFFGLGAPPKEPAPIKFGVLGASQVATYALVWPTRRMPTADVVAVAARDGNRAHEYAQKHRIKKSYGSYEQLLADPEIDAVYVGLPNGLHGQWARKALLAGKHVLCEKPFGANAAEAAEVQALAIRKGLLCREAFHYREHPLATRLRELCLGPAAANQPSHLPIWAKQPAQPGGAGGVLGKLKAIDVSLLIPNWVFGGGNIRWQEQLAGGAMMDAGCYTVNMMRLLTGAEPKVLRAQADLRPGSQALDASMHAHIEWPALPGLKGTLHASLQHSGLLPITRVQVTGDRGTLTCNGFVVPFFGHSIHVKRRHDDTGAGKAKADSQGFEEWVERAFGPDHETTYHHQLQRFTKDLRVLKANTTDKLELENVKKSLTLDQQDCVANQVVIDDVYTAAGLPLRLPTAEWLQLYGSATTTATVASVQPTPTK